MYLRLYLHMFCSNFKSINLFYAAKNDPNHIVCDSILLDFSNFTYPLQLKTNPILSIHNIIIIFSLLN